MVYCPMKKCNYNNAQRDTDEGICTKQDLELSVAHYDYNNFPYCSEYSAKYWNYKENIEWV